jgi:hypothetical protein
MALRHYESATMPAKVFSKFIQNNKNTWSYILFEARLAIASLGITSFTMHSGCKVVETKLC